MHFSMPSSYRLSTWRPWMRSGFTRLGPESFTYGTVTVRPVSVPLNILRNVTPNPSR